MDAAANAVLTQTQTLFLRLSAISHAFFYVIRVRCSIQTNKIIWKSAEKQKKEKRRRKNMKRTRIERELNGSVISAATYGVRDAFISFHLIFMSIFVPLLHFVFRSMCIPFGIQANRDEEKEFERIKTSCVCLRLPIPFRSLISRCISCTTYYVVLATFLTNWNMSLRQFRCNDFHFPPRYTIRQIQYKCDT